MRHLRTVLIIFGWVVPITAIFETFISITMLYTVTEFSEAMGPVSIWQILRFFLDGIRSLAISPLCFFGAYLLAEKT